MHATFFKGKSFYEDSEILSFQQETAPKGQDSFDIGIADNIFNFGKS